MREIKCAVCGKVFESEQWNAKYCCQKCYKIGSKPAQKESYKKYLQRKAEQRRVEQSAIVGKCEICGEPVLRESGRRKYCSNECVRISQNISAKKTYAKKNKSEMYHKEALKAELKEIRKKSQLDKNIKDLKKNGEKLGLKPYDYGKYAHLKGL